MIRLIALVGGLIIATLAHAQVSNELYAICPSHFFQCPDDGGPCVCIKGEAWESAGTPVSDPPVINWWNAGGMVATVCRTPDCGKDTLPFEEPLPVTGCHPEPCPPPPSGRIVPNWRNYNPGATK